MAEYTEYDIEDEDDYSGTDLVKKLRKQIDQLQKQVKERDSLLEDFQTYSHEAEVGAVLEQFGLNPRIAQFIPSDVEADPDAVAEWLNEYGDAFGITAVDESVDDYQPDLDAQAYEHMSEIEDGSGDAFVGQDLQSRISNASTPEELTNLLRGR